MAAMSIDEGFMKLSKKSYTPAPAPTHAAVRVQFQNRSALPKLPFGLQAVRDPESGTVRVVGTTTPKQPRFRA